MLFIINFCDLLLQHKIQEWTATKRLETDWQFAKRNCYRFSRISWALAQISCPAFPGEWPPCSIHVHIHLQIWVWLSFYIRKQLLLSAHLNHHNFAGPSVYLSHGSISQKRCKLESPHLHRRLHGRLEFQEPQSLSINSKGVTPNEGAKWEGVGKICDFWQISCYISVMVRDRA